MFRFPWIGALHKKTEHDIILPPEEEWPEHWKRTLYKTYPRLKQISLPAPSRADAPFQTVLDERKSRRDFSRAKEMTLNDISTFLYWSGGERAHPDMALPQKRRFYASAGARYPLEIYLSTREGRDLPQGVHHYNVGAHCLEQLLGGEGDALIRALPTYPWARDAFAYVFISAIFDRTMDKYKERGYRFALLEAGALLQQMYLVAAALRFSFCPLGVNIDEHAREILDLPPEEHILIHGVLGKA